VCIQSIYRMRDELRPSRPDLPLTRAAPANILNHMVSIHGDSPARGALAEPHPRGILEALGGPTQDHRARRAFTSP